MPMWMSDSAHDALLMERLVAKVVANEWCSNVFFLLRCQISKVLFGPRLPFHFSFFLVDQVKEPENRTGGRMLHPLIPLSLPTHNRSFPFLPAKNLFFCPKLFCLFSLVVSRTFFLPSSDLHFAPLIPYLIWRKREEEEARYVVGQVFVFTSCFMRVGFLPSEVSS